MSPPKVTLPKKNFFFVLIPRQRVAGEETSYNWPLKLGVGKAMFVGVDLGGTKIIAGVVDREGRILAKASRPTEAEKGGEQVMRKIIELTREVVDEAGLNLSQIEAIGVGTPGCIDFKRGVVASFVSNIPGWQGMEIGKRLKEATGRPSFADNDVNVMALGEAIFGAAKGARGAICVAIGTGIGGGIVIEGRIFRGASFFAGEIGHMSVNAQGRRCGCGAYGCVEAYSSGPAMERRAEEGIERGIKTKIPEVAKELGEPKVTAKAIFEAARRGDAFALEVIYEAMAMLGALLGGVINLLNPDKVVIGGGVARDADVFLPILEREIRRWALSASFKACQVVVSKLGEEAGIIGAAALAMQEIKARGEG